MGKIAGTIRKCGRYLFRCVLILSIFPFYAFTFIQDQYVRRESEKVNSPPGVKTVAYKSAFQPLERVPRDEVVLSPEKAGYTIQVCSLTVLVDDPFFGGRYKIKAVRMGELYRYIFSSYTTLDAARKDLPGVRKVFPKAFIREYDGNKLGKAIDLEL